MRLADAVDADAIGGRRLIRLELGAELTRHHAARLVDLHDPRAAQIVEVLVDGTLGDGRAEPKAPRVRVARERLAHEAEILSKRIALDEELAISLRALGAREHGEDGVVWPTVGGEPDFFHRPVPASCLY